MKVRELIKQLHELPQDIDVFYRPVLPMTGNIQEVFFVTQESYGFFGKALPCVILCEDGEEDDNLVR